MDRISKGRYFKVMAGIGCIIVLGVILYHMLGRPMLYEFPAGFQRWAIIQFKSESCPSLSTRGIFLVVSVPKSGQVCTSTGLPDGWIYYKFEYIYPDGARKSLRWNDHGKSGTQVWLMGYSPADKSYEIFVGDEESMDHSGAPPPHHE